METTLHKQLKEHYCDENSQTEVRWGRYRIDVVSGDRLIEIQHSGLGAIRDKIRNLIQEHTVEVVKPLIARKKIVRLDRPDGKIVSERWSPLRRSSRHLFEELLHFTNVFPHPNLRLVVPLIEVRELRFPGHGRRRRWRANDHQVADQLLVQILETQVYRTKQDLCRLIPEGLPNPFDTVALAEALQIHRHEAQRVAYVLRETGATRQVDKVGNRRIYRLCK